MKLKKTAIFIIIIVILIIGGLIMAMSFGGISKQKVATVIVAADGTGDATDITVGIGLLPATGGVVYIKEGTYEPTATITIPYSNISIFGSGHSTIIKPTNAIGSDILFSATSKDHLYFSDFFVDGSNAASMDFSIYINDGERCFIKTCWFDVENEAVSLMNGSTYCQVTNLDFTGTGGIGLTESNYNIITFNRGDGVSDVITLVDSDNNIIIGNRVAEINVDDANCSKNLIVGNNCSSSVADNGVNTLNHLNIGGIYYWSCAGNAFIASNPDTDAVYKDPDEGTLILEANAIFFTCPLNLPNGAIVTGAIVYGSPTDETWYLRRLDLTNPGFAVSLATANIGTEDTSISNATIDNSQYAYFFETGSLDTDDQIYGARITYTF